jgi:hypothetical protein
MTDIFGTIKPGNLVEQAVIDTHKLWMETYIAELSLQIDWTDNKIPTPRTYTTRNQFDSFTRDSLPQLIVVSPGLAGPPVKNGDGSYRATWSVGVGIVCSAKDEATTKALAKFYAACSRAIMIQNGSLGGKAIGVIWVDESYDDLPGEEDTSDSLAAGVGYYRVEMDDVGTWKGGPRVPFAPKPDPDPVTQPGSAWPTADEVDITLNREAL